MRAVRKILGALLLSGFGLPACTGARADVVRVITGPSHGQGWMFLDADATCKVVTAAHVVGDDGHPRDVKILTTTGITYWPSRVDRLEGVDIAVMRVPAADDPTRCGPGRLSATGAEQRLRSLSDGWIETTEQTGTVDAPVRLRGTSIDEHGGETFAVLPLLRTDGVVQGWSGSVVLDRFGPLGIVTEVNRDGEAIAVRVDVIRGLLSKLVAAVPLADGTSDRPDIFIEAGDPLDGSQTPSRVLDASGPGWVARPRRGTVVLDAVFHRDLGLSTVELEADGGSRGRLLGLEVYASADAGGALVDISRCSAGDGLRLSCRFAPRTARRLRLVVNTADDLPIGLRALRTR